MFSKANKGKGADTPMLTEINDVAAEPMVKRASTSAKGNARPRSSSRPAGVPSIISSDMIVRGTVESAGEIQFDGEIDGSIFAKGLVIGEGAKVVGEIVAEKVRVSGTVEGSIRGVTVELASSAHVKGDIVHTSLSIENGARFEGNCRHSEDPTGEASSAPQPKARPIPPPPPSADASARPIARPAEAAAARRDRAMPQASHAAPLADAEIELPEHHSPRQTTRELMPTRPEPQPDRTFVPPSKSVSDLR